MSKIPRGREIKNVKDLRKYLDEMEASWTEKDDKFLGPFEYQAIWIPYFTKDGKFEGYYYPSIDYPVFACCIVLDRPKNDTNN